MNRDSQWSKQEACLACATQVWLTVNHKTSSLLANEFDVWSVLHRQVSLAAVNRIYVVHEAMNGCKKSKDSLKACFEYVNIDTCVSATTECIWYVVCVTQIFSNSHLRGNIFVRILEWKGSMTGVFLGQICGRILAPIQLKNEQKLLKIVKIIPNFLALHFGENFMKIGTKIPKMHENLHKNVNGNMFSSHFYANFHKFFLWAIKATNMWQLYTA